MGELYLEFYWYFVEKNEFLFSNRDNDNIHLYSHTVYTFLK